MTIQQIEQTIVEKKLEADKFLQPEDGSLRCAYKAVQPMLELENIMNIYVQNDGIDIDVCAMIYIYLAEGFGFIPYLPKAAENYKKALECAVASSDETVGGEIPELIYNIAKTRNTIARDRFYCSNSKLACAADDKNTVYDECSDIYDIVSSKLEQSEISRLITAAAQTACRQLIADSAEHTEEYLKLVSRLNSEILENLAGMEEKPEFSKAYWAAKKVFLANHGIKWQSPAALNPDVKF